MIEKKHRGVENEEDSYLITNQLQAQNQASSESQRSYIQNITKL